MHPIDWQTLHSTPSPCLPLQEKLLSHLGVVLYEYLGEEYPEVLGSILGGLKAIVNVIGMTKMTPPIKDLLPRLTPILKNRCVYGMLVTAPRRSIVLHCSIQGLWFVYVVAALRSCETHVTSLGWFLLFFPTLSLG